MFSLKSVLPIGIFLIILCGDLHSQSIFLDTGSLRPVSSNQFVHGFGVSPIGSFNSDTAYKKACELALEELNSNKFISVYIEQFKTGANAHYTFPELSIKDSTLTYSNNIVKADSFEVANQAYCISIDKNLQGVDLTIPDLEELKISPIKKNGMWYAMGAEKASKYNPYRAWLISKNNALKDLTRTITTTIQSSTLESNISYAEFTYFKSYVIYKNVIVAGRYLSSENQFVTIIAVNDAELMRID